MSHGPFFQFCHLLPSEQLRLLQRSQAHGPGVGSPDFQSMIEANRKWLEHYRNDPTLYPLTAAPQAVGPSCGQCRDG